MSKNKTLQLYFHHDPGHGWLAVKRSLLAELGIEDKISEHSYQSSSGSTAYLEEDLDAGVFINAAKEAGYNVSFRETGVDYQHQIRSYPRFKPFPTCWKRGDKVHANGFNGVIRDVYIAPSVESRYGMYEVRLPGGMACICGSEITKALPE